MKVWIEFPEETRFARLERDILYTPIYFANEPITAHLRLDNEWQSTYGDEIDSLFKARSKMIGKASLGFLSVGGRPVAGIDTRFAFPNLGFKPIYTLEILNIVKRVGLAGLEYDATDGVRGGRVPFTFRLPTSTLEDIQQIASSLKVITADNVSTLGLLEGITPALIVTVQYTLIVDMLDAEDQVKSTCKEEIRIFISLAEEQVPTSMDQAVVSNPMAKFVTTQVVPMNQVKSRRGSIPLVRRLSRASTQEPSLMTIDVEHVEPFTFTRQSDAAASKVTISLRYSTDTLSPGETPSPVIATIRWMLKSLTSLTLEPMDRGDDDETHTDDFFHLRQKVLPSRKLKLQWTDWQRLPESDSSHARWKSTQHVYLVKSLSEQLSPAFVTPYLAHTYFLNLQVSFAENESKISRGLTSGAKLKVDLDVPVQLRYELGLVPSYAVDESLPEYDHTLPLYEEIEGGDAPADEADDEATDLPDISALNLTLTTTTSNTETATAAHPVVVQHPAAQGHNPPPFSD